MLYSHTFTLNNTFRGLNSTASGSLLVSGLQAGNVFIGVQVLVGRGRGGGLCTTQGDISIHSPPLPLPQPPQTQPALGIEGDPMRLLFHWEIY